MSVRHRKNLPLLSQKDLPCTIYHPLISCIVIQHFISHLYSWSWTTKAGSNQGKTFSVPTIPITCEKDAHKALHWTVSLFHFFKFHLNPEALDLEMERMLPSLVKIYQSNMLLHYWSQIANQTSKLPKPKTTPPALQTPLPSKCNQHRL